MDIAKLKKIRMYNPKSCIIKGLPDTIKDADELKLKKWFGCFGNILNIQLYDDSFKSKWTIIQFTDEYTAGKVIKYCNNTNCGFNDGRKIKARYECQRYCHLFLQHSKCLNKQCKNRHKLCNKKDIAKKPDLKQFQKKPYGLKEIVKETVSIKSKAKNNQIQISSNHPSNTVTHKISETHKKIKTKQQKVRLLLNEQHARSLIGKNNATIRNIRQLSKCKIIITDTICNITGNVNQIIIAINLIIVGIPKNKSSLCNVTILLDLKNISYLIGKNGTVINDIRSQIKANIQISRSLLANSTEQTINVSGDIHSVRNGVALIINRIFDNPFHIDVQLPYGVILTTRNICIDPCKNKFKIWLTKTCGFPEYLSICQKKEYDDITMIEFLDEDAICNHLNISNKIHAKLILKRIDEFKIMMNDFKEKLKNNKEISLFKQELTAHGILRWNDLITDIKSKVDIKRILKTNDESKINAIFDFIHGTNGTNQNDLQ